MINYLRDSLKRKKARRITREYPYKISTFHLEEDGNIEFANWENPLVKTYTISQSEVDFFRKFIKKGDVVIDIGANIGDTTVPMAIAAGSEGVAIGFDPNPIVFKVLEINASLNKSKSNIILYMKAITVEEEDFYFISSEASFANGGISRTKESIHGKFILPHKIKGVNLINFLNKNHRELIDRLTFIKIDAEGYDKEIIKSISDLIRQYKPFIVAESYGESSDEAKMELFEVISKLGYKVFYFEDFLDNTYTQEIKKAEEMTNWKNYINVYAIPI